MCDKVVFLNKDDFNEDAWKTLSWNFRFNDEETHVAIHIIEDED